MHGVQSSVIRDLLKLAQRPGIISLAGGLPSPLTFDGVTLYGTVDVGLAYLTHGAPLSAREMAR